MPALPLQYENNISLDLSNLSLCIHELEDQRQQAYEFSRQIQVALVQASARVGQPNATEPLRNLVRQIHHTQQQQQPPLQPHARQPRLANLSMRIEGVLRLEAYQYFLETGRLVPLSTLAQVYGTPPTDHQDTTTRNADDTTHTSILASPPLVLTDEEYLAGACMGLAYELQRYGLGRATVRDVTSVQQAASLMSATQNFLLQLDFRNGPLRRKFDGTKYSLKALETYLYELAVTSSSSGTGTSDNTSTNNTGGDANHQDSNEPDHKRLKLHPSLSNDDSLLIPTEELQALILRMDHRDQLRETLIKTCRDSQKASKQAIFALHRLDRRRARLLLQQCRDSIQTQLLPIVVEQEPPLRSGSFSNVLEEYVEARLFAAWLYGKEDWLVAGDNDSMSSNVKAVGVLLTPEDFTEVGTLEPEEYLGGLCDLTGEVGRYAVQRGTARDVQAVQLCLQTNAAIFNALQAIVERLPSSVHKKMDMVRSSVEKIERMLYELSLSEAAGGRNVKSDAMDLDVNMEPSTDD